MQKVSFRVGSECGPLTQPPARTHVVVVHGIVEHQCVCTATAGLDKLAAGDAAILTINTSLSKYAQYIRPHQRWAHLLATVL